MRQIPRVPAKGGSRIPAPLPLQKSTLHEKVLFSFELFESSECPSTWGPEIKHLFSAFRKASERTWMQVMQTSGKGENKTGLGFTEFDAPPFSLRGSLSPDLRISEMRVTQKARLFGFRKNGIYYVLELDRNHRYCQA